MKKMVPTLERKFQCTVGLYVPPESAEYKVSWKYSVWSWPCQFGIPLKGACLEALKQLFADAYEVPALPPSANDPEPDFIIAQTIENAESSFEIPLTGDWKAGLSARLRWELLEPDGNRLFSVARSAQESLSWPANGGDRLAESVAKKLLADLANDLATQHADRMAEALSRRAKIVGFAGWVCPTELESMGGVLSDYIRKALGGPQYRALSAEEVAAGLKREDASLAELITDKSKMVAVARSLRCGAVLVGQIQREGENLRLSLLKFDRLTGARAASAEQVAQADDVKGLLAAVEKMLSSLQLGQRAP
jgi:hypothetical protein